MQYCLINEALSVWYEETVFGLSGWHSSIWAAYNSSNMMLKPTLIIRPIRTRALKCTWCARSVSTPFWGGLNYVLIEALIWFIYRFKSLCKMYQRGKNYCELSVIKNLHNLQQFVFYKRYIFPLYSRELFRHLLRDVNYQISTIYNQWRQSNDVNNCILSACLKVGQRQLVMQT